MRTSLAVLLLALCGCPRSGDVVREPVVCAPISDVDVAAYEAWGASRGYVEILDSCGGPSANVVTFLVSRDPRVEVVAVCNGKGVQRCVVTETRQP